MTVGDQATVSKVSVTVKKVWNDSENNDGKRPTSINVDLMRNGTEKVETVTLSAVNDWTAAVNDLPEYTEKVKNSYTWTEREVPEGYKLVSNVTAGTVTTITNGHETEKTALTVKKVWDDAENNDGKRPASIDVVLKNGTETVQTVTLSAADNWTETVSNLPAYTEGTKNSYSWTEENVPEGYKLESNTTEGTVTTITNGHETEKTALTVKKVWDDAENNDGKRPASIDVVLKNGTETIQTVTLSAADNWAETVSNLPVYTEGTKNSYSWTEENVPEGYKLESNTTEGTVTTITNRHETEKAALTVKKVWDDSDNNDGKRPASIDVVLKNGTETVQTVTLSAADNWAETVSNLPVYTEGTKNSYSWTEDTTGLPAGYSIKSTETEGQVTTITNTYAPGKVSATVKKIWDDSDNNDGKRPASIDVVLKNGSEMVQTVTLNKADSWTETVTDLPEYTNGVKNNYSWTEENVPEGYKLESNTTEGTVTTITNRHETEKTALTVKKVWDDAENNDGKRPASIDVVLKNGSETVQTVTLNAADNWTETVSNLPVYTEGTKNSYSWTEDTTGLPAGYSIKSTETEGQVTTITNTYAPGKVSATVKKVWDDSDNNDGKRPASIDVVLKNGSETVQTVTLNEADSWTETVTDLPEYTNGVKNNYSWIEENVPDGYKLESNTTEGTVTTITNGHETETISISVNKNWDDNQNQKNTRPSSITYKLFADGTLTDTVNVSAQDNWTYVFTNLDVYKNHGEKVIYTVTEADVTSYTSSVSGSADSGFTVTNTYYAGNGSSSSGNGGSGSSSGGGGTGGHAYTFNGTGSSETTVTSSETTGSTDSALISADIADSDTPLVSNFIPDSSVPLAALPDTSVPFGVLGIEDGDVPLAALPMTGDKRTSHAAAFMLSAFAFFGLALTRRKKKKETEDSDIEN